MSIDEQAQVISADFVVVRHGIDAIAPAANLVGAAEDGTQPHARRKGLKASNAGRKARGVFVRCCSKGYPASGHIRWPERISGQCGTEFSL